MDEDDDEEDGRSQKSRGDDAKSKAARTARASEWGKTAIFSDEDGGGEEDTKWVAECMLG